MPLQRAVPTGKSPRFSAQTKNFKHASLPPPSKGLDVSLPLPTQAPDAAVVLDNFLCRRMGVEMRAGSERWTTNLGGIGTEAVVSSLMAYHPPRGAGGAFIHRLFAGCDDTNVYEVSSQTDEATVPVVSQALPGQIVPGRLSWTNFSTPAANFLVVCAAGIGVWTFDHVGGWVNRTAAITGTAGANIAFDFVMSWKNRLWFIQNDTTKAWFLPVNSIAGAASQFDFGPLFVFGGELEAMASWTVDGGDGIDDKLVIVSQNGDVLIYEGTDPTTAADFRIKGRWFTGKPPSGRRFLSKYAGDLAMITERGIEYMSRLLQGLGLLDPESRDAANSARRFNEVIGQEVRSTREQTFWRLLSITGQDGVIISTPYNSVIHGHQFFFGTLAQAWSRLVGWDAVSVEEFDGEMFYGTNRGTVHKAFTGETDDALSDGTAGTLPNWELQTSFTAPNQDNTSLKRPGLVHVLFQGSRPPEIKLQINTEWSTRPVPGSPALGADVEALWDIALWDVGYWSGDINSYSTWVGVEGLGAYFSLRMKVRGAPGTVFNSWTVIYEPGGPM